MKYVFFFLKLDPQVALLSKPLSLFMAEPSNNLGGPSLLSLWLLSQIRRGLIGEIESRANARPLAGHFEGKG